MKKTILAAFAATALTAGISTSASALTLDYIGLSAGKGVKLHGATSPTSVNNVLAGGLKMSSTEIAPFDSFVAWCLDIGTSIKTSYDYSLKAISDTLFTNGGTAVLLSNAQKQDIQSLFNTAYSTLDVLDANKSAGFQLALWEIAYESSGSYSLAGGDFYATQSGSVVSAVARAQADSFLAGLGGAVTGNYTLAFFESNTTSNGHGSQNLVMGFVDPSVIAEAPLPAAAWLLIGGMGALGMASRRRKAA